MVLTSPVDRVVSEQTRYETAVTPFAVSFELIILQTLSVTYKYKIQLGCRE